MVIIEQRYAN